MAKCHSTTATALFVLMLACSSLFMLPLAHGQDCGPPGGRSCSGSGCCSQFGYCGNSCDYCGAGCQGGYGRCGGCSCFPGTATVITPSGTKPISELRVGEQVGVHDGRGGMAFEAVYAHAHSDANAESEFIILTLHNHADNATRTLELTPRHFTIVQGSTEPHNLQYKQAQDVRIGDRMLVASLLAKDGHSHLSPFMVSDIRVELMTGLYKPLTLGGDIVVNHVLASCHSEWFFNSLLKQAWGTHALPSIYQAIFSPLRLIFNVMPTDAYVWMYENAQTLPKKSIAPRFGLQSHPINSVVEYIATSTYSVHP